MKRGFVGVTNIAQRETLLSMSACLLFVARLRAVRPVEIEPRAHVDGHVDHLAVERHRGHAAFEPLREYLSYAHVIRGLFRTRAKALVAGLDPRDVRAQRALETGVARAAHGLGESTFARVLVREAERMAHALRLAADRCRDGDDFGFH